MKDKSVQDSDQMFGGTTSESASNIDEPKLTSPFGDRFHGRDPVGMRAVRSAQAFLSSLIEANILSATQTGPVAAFVRQLSSLPRGFVTRDICVEVALDDKHELAISVPAADVVMVCLRSESGVLCFDICGTFAHDNYNQSMFCVEFGDLLTRGSFAHLIAWEFCSRQLISLRPITIVVD
ncbi:MAG: hypothetical protein OEL20_15110 [Sulfuritalea sp.]|nr:hypothetical protein [Sulfuritalea sp.]